MKLSTLFLLTPIPLAMAAAAILMPHSWVSLSVGGTAIIIITTLLILIYRGFMLPYKAAELGLDLLNSQELNNRLAHVGEPGADRIVDLFNRLSAHLREESIRLREQDTLISSIIQISPVGIAMLDLQLRVSTANNSFATLCGTPLDNILGKDIRTVESDIVKTLLDLKEGEERVVSTSRGERLKCCSHHFMSQGFRRRFFRIEPLSEEIRIAEKNAYEKVIRMISHEVNNTLGGVDTVLQSIADDPGFDDDIRQLATSTSQRCAAMSEFITSFASLARIPSPRLTRISLRKEIEAQLPFLASMCGSVATVHLTPGEEVTTLADSSLLQQCIVNIVKNGVEAIAEIKEADTDSSPDGCISIGVAATPEGAELSISNNGAPISPETIASIFTPFFSTKRSGRGIGLTLVSEILHRHGAYLSVNSTEQLTTFTIHLPATNRN